MFFFLGQRERDREALETFDPLRGTWLLGYLDPRQAGDSKATPSWLRVGGVILVIFLPMAVLAAIPSPLFGGKFIGKGSLTADIGIYSVLLFLIVSAALIPIGRRMIGDLMNELQRLGIVDRRILAFEPRRSSGNIILRSLEWLSRVDGYRGMIWFILMLADQLVSYFMVVLKDANPTWQSTAAVDGSILGFLSVGVRQPTLAGLWAYIVWGQCILYLMIIIARLLVVFACLCEFVASNRELKILPNHPDGTGGLRPIGLTALFFSLFTFAGGIDLAGLTINEFVIDRVFRAADQQSTSNLRVLFVLWVLYFVFGTALFLLPLLPLRRRMAEAKRSYLLKVSGLIATAARDHDHDLEKGIFRPDSLQGHVALDGLFRAADEMAVWPFDRKTFARYGGLLVSPLIPVFADRLPLLVAWFKSYVGLH